MSKNVVEFTDENFATEVESGNGLTVVDFWAPWCGPCRFVAPVIDALADEYEGKAKIGKLNVDDNPATASRYGIRSIPTIGLFKDRSEEHTSELQSRGHLVCRLLLDKKKVPQFAV